MINLTLDHTVSILDSSKLGDYMCCPRRFMFRHIFGWSGNSFHLKFGERFHLAIEHCLNTDFSDENILIAMNIFGQGWPAEYENESSPKNITSAFRALKKYSEEYKKERFKILHTEIGGLVPVSETRKLAFKLDALVEDELGNYWVLEHKTGSRNSQVWEAQWYNRYQLHCYTHALKMAFPPERAKGVIVNGIFFLKNKQEFNRVRVSHSNEMQLLYLDEVNYWLDLLEQDIETYLTHSEDDPILRCFSRKPDNCTSFNSVCPYFDICNFCANPLKVKDKNPLSFKIDFWNPLNKEIRVDFENLKKEQENAQQKG